MLEFITSLTIAVYSNLLRKHRGVPAAAARKGAGAAATAFGSSSTRMGGSAQVRAEPSPLEPSPPTSVVAEGQALPVAKKASPAKPREAARKAGQVFVIPGPPNTAALWQRQKAAQATGSLSGRVRAAVHSGRAQVSVHAAVAGLPVLDGERLEEWQGWRTASSTPADGSMPLPGSSVETHAEAQIPVNQLCSSGTASCQHLANAHRAAAVPGQAGSAGSQDGSRVQASEEGSRVSCYSDASSWQLD